MNMHMVHDTECGMPCTKKDCKDFCDWISIHNQDDGLHLCWKHIKEYEKELHTKEELK